MVLVDITAVRLPTLSGGESSTMIPAIIFRRLPKALEVHGSSFGLRNAPNGVRPKAGKNVKKQGIE